MQTYFCDLAFNLSSSYPAHDTPILYVRGVDRKYLFLYSTCRGHTRCTAISQLVLTSFRRFLMDRDADLLIQEGSKSLSHRTVEASFLMCRCRIK